MTNAPITLNRMAPYLLDSIRCTAPVPRAAALELAAGGSKAINSLPLKNAASDEVSHLLVLSSQVFCPDKVSALDCSMHISVCTSVCT